VPEPDAVDAIVAQWRRERPDLDHAPIEIFGRLVRAGRLAEARQDVVFARFGLTGPDYDILATLRRSGEPYRLTPTALRRTAMVSSGGMTKRIDRLERLGHVRRVADPGDRRSVLVELTPGAHAVLDDIVVAHLGNEEAMLASLDARRRAAVVAALRDLLAALEERPGAA
jgi:DNA-binding MarR family transcriptional regulator